MFKSKLFAWTMVLVYCLQPVAAYGKSINEMTEDEILAEHGIVKPEMLQLRIDELEKDNEYLSTANSTLLGTAQMLQAQVAQKNAELNQRQPESSSNWFLWTVVGIAAGGAAGYFGAKHIK